MNEPDFHRSRDVDDLLALIGKKLQANRGILKKSISYGRLVWRSKRNGEIEVDLELRF